MSNIMSSAAETDKKMAMPLRDRYGLSIERLKLISQERFKSFIPNEVDRARFLDAEYVAHYRLLALLSCLFDQATIFDVGTGSGYASLALSYHPHNMVISYDSKDLRELKSLESLCNIEFNAGSVCGDARLAEAKLVVMDMDAAVTSGKDLYSHLKQVGFRGLLCLTQTSRDAAMPALWNEIELPKEDLSDLGASIGVCLVDFSEAAGMAVKPQQKEIMDAIHAADQIRRSFVIPVLDLSPHSRFSIVTLLDDLEQIDGEVICIFNSPEVFKGLRHHPRIDKYCYNKLNAGVGRSWNMGIDLAEGDAVFVMNADLHVGRTAIEDLEAALYRLPKAVLIGPHGSMVDFEKLRVIHYYHKGNFDKPVQTHDVSGFFFCLHLERFLSRGLRFDSRYSPCFMEEWDMALQVLKANLACYAVPITDFEHDWGVSANNTNPEIVYFGRSMRRNDILIANHKRFREKWFTKSTDE